MLRALSLSLYLLFPSDEGKLGVEAIGSKQLHRGLKILKQKPVVPGFGDMPLTLTFILHELSPFLIAHGMQPVYPVHTMLQASSSSSWLTTKPFISLWGQNAYGCLLQDCRLQTGVITQLAAPVNASHQPACSAHLQSAAKQP